MTAVTAGASRHCAGRSLQATKRSIFECVEVCCNRWRIQDNPGCLAPFEYEMEIGKVIALVAQFNRLRQRSASVGKIVEVSLEYYEQGGW